MKQMQTNTKKFFNLLLAGKALQAWEKDQHLWSSGDYEEKWDRPLYPEDVGYYHMVSSLEGFTPPAFYHAEDGTGTTQPRVGEWVFYPWLEEAAHHIGGSLTVSELGEVRLNAPEPVGLDRRRMMAEGSSPAKIWAAKAARFIDTLEVD